MVWKMLSKVLSICLIILAMHQADATCRQRRVRKSYDRMNTREKTLFRNAIQDAMDRGYNMRFTEIHMESQSEMQAHQVCTFIYWHRAFLLGYENMLRSLRPEYECLTVPYWDTVTHSANEMDGDCSSTEGCSPVVGDLGGTQVGIQTPATFRVNGRRQPTGYRCVTSSPMDHFCQDRFASGDDCYQCLPRENLRSRSLPSAVTFNSVYRQLFSQEAFNDFRPLLEYGMHNSMHNNIGGSMATFQGTGDPLFWVHHSFVDLLASLYYFCHGVMGRLSSQEMRDNIYSFQTCESRSGGDVTADTEITFRDGGWTSELPAASVWDPSHDLYPFFENVPRRFSELADISQLGESTYTYSVGGLMLYLMRNCEDSNRNIAERRLSEMAMMMNATEVGDNNDAGCDFYGGKIKKGVTPDQKKDMMKDLVKIKKDLENSPEGCPFDLDATEEEIDKAPATVKMQQFTKEVEARLYKKKKQDEGSDITRAMEIDDASAAAKDHDDILIEIERMTCMYYEKCLYGTPDYSPEFKEAFGVTDPPACKQIVDEIKADTTGEKQLKLPNWDKVFTKYFNCPKEEGVAAYVKWGDEIGDDTTDGLFDPESSGSGALDIDIGDAEGITDDLVEVGDDFDNADEDDTTAPVDGDDNVKDDGVPENDTPASVDASDDIDDGDAPEDDTPAPVETGDEDADIDQDDDFFEDGGTDFIGDFK